MKKVKPEYIPVEGKTYSLFGDSDSTSAYYNTIRMLADEILVLNNSKTLIEDIANFSSNKRVLKKSLKRIEPENPMSVLLDRIEAILEKYTIKTEDHLKKLPISKMFDSRLATSREQYHLYMLEIELTNRRYASEFIIADKKIALLPYCLQDFSVSCKSEKMDFDYKCKHCSPGCYQNHASKILEANNIEPYIWMEGDMKRLAQYTLKDKKTFGVLGIACIPELTWGMRNCRKNNIPVVGLPLNANRCARWVGEFFPNSVDLEELERISGVKC